MMVGTHVFLVVFLIFSDLICRFMFHAFGYQTSSALAIIDIGKNMVEIIHSGVILVISNSEESPR